MEEKTGRKDRRNWYYPGKILPRYFSNIVKTQISVSVIDTVWTIAES